MGNVFLFVWGSIERVYVRIEILMHIRCSDVLFSTSYLEVVGSRSCSIDSISIRK